jgi:hypothetical protein
MKLVNETGFPATLERADFGSDDRFAVVIWKLTYVLLPGGGADFAPDPMPLHGDPLETPYGTFHGDIFLRKLGADLCVLGRIFRSQPVTSLEVAVRCGPHENRLRVTGDRVWIELPNGELVPSDPVPFTEMELSYARAFGGTALSQGLPAPYADNPIGRGYVVERAHAVGAPLPNIEPAEGPWVTRWDDTPPPAGWGPYPMHWGLRARAAVTIDPELGAVVDLSPAAFNNAHPSLVLPAIAPGDAIEISGVYDQPVTVVVPRVLGNVRLEVGSTVTEVPTHIDGVFVWLDAARLVVTQRANFRYVRRDGELRVATLSMVTV